MESDACSDDAAADDDDVGCLWKRQASPPTLPRDTLNLPVGLMDRPSGVNAANSSYLQGQNSEVQRALVSAIRGRAELWSPF